MDFEEKISLQEEKVENLNIKCDDNKQCSRQYCLRIHGLTYQKSEIGLPYEEAEIDRVHRIGKSCKNESSSLTIRPIITNFMSRKYRQNIY